MSASADNVTILIVDDDPVTIQLLQSQLAPAGYRTLAAENGFQAFNMLRESSPEIIISDWLMPGMDGLELCQAIRSQGQDGFVYFIMLTIQSEKSRLLEAFDSGVDDYLCKPFHPGELLARVRAGVRMVRLYDSLREATTTTVRLNSELARLNSKLQKMANTDALTGLINRRQAIIRLKEYWAIAARYDQPLSCAMIDIDHFKAINDQYGHNKGDEVLQKLGAVLTQCFRAADSVCRIGGEEFLIIMPHTTAEDAFRCAQRCRETVETTCTLGPNMESMTVSIGIAQRDKAKKTCDDLLTAADESLYAAKRAGRNTVALESQLPQAV